MKVQLVKLHSMSKFVYLTHVNGIFFLLSTLYISLFNATLAFRLFIARFWKFEQVRLPRNNYCFEMDVKLSPKINKGIPVLL